LPFKIWQTLGDALRLENYIILLEIIKDTKILLEILRNTTLIFFSAAVMAQAVAMYVRPELFDDAVDNKHRLYLSAVLGEPLGIVRALAIRHLMLIH
jgi:hypothetical protein